MTEVQALQAALATVQQAIYGYGLVGAQLPARTAVTSPFAGGGRAQAQGRLDALLVLRDSLADQVRRADTTPVPAEPAYVPPTPVRTVASAVQLAESIETAVTAAMDELVRASAARSPSRRLAVHQLATAADWASRWWSTSQLQALRFRPALPGQPPASQSSTTPTSSPS